MAKLQRDSDRERFVLDGRELHGGDVVELALESDSWVPARFEWQHVSGGRPKGYFLIGLGGDLDGILFAPVGTQARWPGSAR